MKGRDQRLHGTIDWIRLNVYLRPTVNISQNFSKGATYSQIAPMALGFLSDGRDNLWKLWSATHSKDSMNTLHIQGEKSGGGVVRMGGWSGFHGAVEGGGGPTG